MWRFVLIAGLLVLSGWCVWAGDVAPGTVCVFRASDGGEFTFDTGTLRGLLRAGGKATGLSSVVHVPSGQRVDSSMGLLSHYRVFTKNRRYGTGAWDWPSQATLDSGVVRVTWPATPDRPFAMGAVYRWLSPDTVEVETRVTAVKRLESFESFLASYFSSAFTNASVYARNGSAKEFVSAREADGTWQCFPRDGAAAEIYRDGRWKLEPHPVDWVIRSPHAEPLALRRAPNANIGAAIFAPAADCFAVALPHETESHYSVYLSQFGRDLEPGQTAVARARLVIRAQLDEAGALRAHAQLPRP